MSEILVYWRPGCGFCARPFRQLDAAGVPYRRVNIWDDERAAAAVRQVARGNETVPTVFVGSVPLVNPGVGRILEVAATEVPEAVPAGWQAQPAGRFTGWLRRRLGAGTP